MANFNLNMDDKIENFKVSFGEVVYLTNDDFNELKNRPKYDGQVMTGETNIPKVPVNVSDLENDSDYQTGSDVSSALSAHNESEEAHPYIQGQFAGKQDKLTAGNNIQISEQNVISATDSTYSAGNGINISGANAISVDTTVVATQQNLTDEVTNRENADIYLQQQIDGISASSDVVDIVGTYAELQAYDTQHLKDNDIIKVLQDETQNGATTYYRWSTTTETFTLIGQEGPYYTKAAADAEFVPQTRTVNGKALSSNITLNASDVSALGTGDVVQTTGSSTSQVMSQNAVTTQLNTKLNTSDYVVDSQLANTTNPVQNQVLNGLLGDMPSDFFSGSATTSPEPATDLQLQDAICLDDVQMLGNTTQQTYSGKNLFNKNATYTATANTTAEPLNTGIRVKTSETGNYKYVTYIIGDISQYVGENVVANITISPSGTNNPYFSIGVCKSDGTDKAIRRNLSSSGSTSFAITQTDMNDRPYLYIWAYANTNSDTVQANDYVDYTDFQIEISSGTTPTSYEPYVGSSPTQITPSPNPDYPQDVNVVTGEQTVQVCGKNLFKGGSADYTGTDAWYGYGVSTYTVSDGVYTLPQPYAAIAFEYDNLTVGQQYTLSFDIVSTVSGVCFVGVNRYAGASPTGDNLRIEATTTSQRVSFTFTATATNRIAFNSGSTASFSVSYSNIQLEKSATSTTYEPYQGQNLTIDLGSTELCKIGTYQDYIYKSGGDWYVHKEVKKTVLDGTISWSYYQNNIFYTGSGVISTPANAATICYSDNYMGLTSQASASSFESDATNYGYAIDTHRTNTVVRVKNISYTDANDLKTWFTNNPTDLYYAIATPTDTKITDSTLIGQLEAVLGMTCYDGNTYVEVSASDLAAILDVTVVNANANGLIYKLRGGN